MKSFQKIFNPVDFGFEWVDGWYKWDRRAAQKRALLARNEEVRRLRYEGYEVKTFALPNQLISHGGIGSNNPHVEFVANCYGLNAVKEGEDHD